MKKAAPPIAIERIVEALNKDFEIEMCRRFDRLCVDPKFDVHVGRWHQRFRWRLLVVLTMHVPICWIARSWLDVSLHPLLLAGIVIGSLLLFWYSFGGSTKAWSVRPRIKMKLPPMPNQDGTAKGSKPDPRVAMYALTSWRGLISEGEYRMGHIATGTHRTLSCAEAAKNNPKMTPWALAERIERAHRRYQAKKGLGVLPVRLYSNLVDWVMAVRQRRHHKRMHDVLARHSSQMTSSLEQELDLSMRRLNEQAYGEQIAGSGIEQGDPPTLERMMGQIYVAEAPEEKTRRISALRFDVTVDGKLVNEEIFSAESITIGAGPAAMLRVKSEHGTVAGLHLVMNVNDDRTVQLLDLGSRTGTRLNGEDVSNAVMKDGDRIGIGSDVEIVVWFGQG